MELASIPNTLDLRDAKKPKSLVFKSGDSEGCVTGFTNHPLPIPAELRISGFPLPCGGSPCPAALLLASSASTAFFRGCREKLADVPRLEPLFPPLVSLFGASLGHIEDANAPDADLAVGIVARVRPRVCHNDHDLRKVILVFYARRPGDNLTPEDTNLLFRSKKKKKKLAFVQVDDASLVKKIAGLSRPPDCRLSQSGAYSGPRKEEV